jgi:hypothetical protein
MQEYSRYIAVIFLLVVCATPLIGRVKNPAIRTELRYLAWILFVLGLIGFLIFEALHPPHGWEGTISLGAAPPLLLTL